MLTVLEMIFNQFFIYFKYGIIKLFGVQYIQNKREACEQEHRILNEAQVEVQQLGPDLNYSR